MHNDTFLPIPSLDNLYEINRQGEVRNARTKQPLSPVFSFNIEKTHTCRTVKRLLEEVFDEKKPPQNTQPIDCSCSDGKETHHFPSLEKMATFLAPKIRWKRRSVVVYLGKRIPKIKNWNLKYFDKNESIDTVKKNEKE